MSVKYISVGEIGDTRNEFKNSIKTFEGYVREVNKAADDLRVAWSGKGYTQFEHQYALMKRQLDDISDILYEVYEALLDAETAYIDVDEAVAKQISAGTM